MLGVSPAAAANVARFAVDGAVATKVRTANGLVDVRVQFPPADRNTVDALKNVRVRAQDGTLVPLGDVADFSWTKAPTKIERLNRAARRQRATAMFCRVTRWARSPGRCRRSCNQPGFLPAGVGLTAQGDSQFMKETIARTWASRSSPRSCSSTC